jgi:hypothetical protein
MLRGQVIDASGLLLRSVLVSCLLCFAFCSSLITHTQYDLRFPHSDFLTRHYWWFPSPLLAECESLVFFDAFASTQTTVLYVHDVQYRKLFKCYFSRLS